MIDEHYANPKLAGLYDRDNGWSEDRDYYLSLAPSHAIDILDLGCGTGLLCNAYAAQGHRVTGVDPAQPMLDVAGQKPHSKNVEWICATAQSFRSEKRFDLIIMTGHAFQVFLTDEDVAAVLKTMQMHLKPDGRAIFESRNPNIDWASQWDREINPSKSQRFEAVSHISNTITFDMHYTFENETITSRSTLRFMTREEVERHATQAGLTVTSAKGDWHGGDFANNTSLEMIFETRLLRE
jgi:2-polyprenyl-3-methyl-5-hydroxy-6-metoxy-1,4-benzoquinol methylase